MAFLIRFGESANPVGKLTPANRLDPPPIPGPPAHYLGGQEVIGSPGRIQRDAIGSRDYNTDVFVDNGSERRAATYSGPACPTALAFRRAG